MRVYVLIATSYEDIDFGPILAKREDAEALAEELGNAWEVEEHEVLTERPRRVEMAYVQRYRDGREATGIRTWWDYEVAGLPSGPWIAWAPTEAKARAMLEQTPLSAIP